MAEVNDLGLVQVYMGHGKGKSTAVFGLAFRAVGQGLNVLIVQFMKSTDFITGEMVAARRLTPELKVIQFGDSKVWGLGVPKTVYEDNAKEATLQAFNYATKQVRAGWDLLILDEIGVAMHLGLIEEEKVVQFIKSKPRQLELILTGLEMSKSVIDTADLVSEINDLKHPYNYGIEARKGIEY